MWLWIALGIGAGIPLAVALFLFGLFIYLRLCYSQYTDRVFQEKPLFIIPRGQPAPGAEEVELLTPDGLKLKGCYLRTSAPRRQGVILFGLEYGSNRWACIPYCEHLLASGFDVFTFEPRGQGDSEVQPGYEPLQWITSFEVADAQTALAYLKARPDADPRGIGFFGISKGGGAGLLAAARDPFVRCFVTDGIFATYSTMVPYMQKWICIYSNKYWLQAALPYWYYGLVGRGAMRRIARARHCRFVDLEPALPLLAPRPLFMIHGGADTYIKPEMAQELFRRARQPKELWLVPNAKHNQSIQIQGDEYRRRVLEFFQAHLAEKVVNEAPRSWSQREAGQSSLPTVAS